MTMPASWYEDRRYDGYEEPDGLPATCSECGQYLDGDWEHERERVIAFDERHYEWQDNWFMRCKECGYMTVVTQ